ncbi:hypothetical protein EGK76_04935 [Luteimonas sp. 100069]|nr:hypothetical protein EGK76_04935 [Luteimonas sp. 100069]
MPTASGAARARRWQCRWETLLRPLRDPQRGADRGPARATGRGPRRPGARPAGVPRRSAVRGRDGSWGEQHAQLFHRVARARFQGFAPGAGNHADLLERGPR